MARLFGDESGLFWHDEIIGRSFATRLMPPLPEKLDWKLPASFPDLSGQGMIAIDCETHDPDLRRFGPGVRRDGRLVGVAVGTEAGFRGYYPFDHQEGPQFAREPVIAWLKQQLTRPGQPKVGANLLYDLDYLEAAGIKVAGPFYDIQIAEPLLDETALSFSLNNIAKRRLDEFKVEEEMTAWLIRAFGDVSNLKGNIWRAPPAIVGPYAEGDVDLPLRIFAKQKVELERQEGLWDLFILESKLMPMLLAMRQRGVPVDLPAAEKLSKRMEDELGKLRRQIARDYNFCPDIWAAGSLSTFFNKLALPYPLTEKTKAPSFRKEWLANHDHPGVRLIQRMRTLDKLNETFIKGYVLEGHVKSRVHCQFNQLRSDQGGTVSGRFSSANPNLQNIPIRDPEFGDQIRALFIPEPEHGWLKLDWSQIEYRLICHYAALTKQPGIQPIIDRYHQDRTTDYHQAVADLTGRSRAEAKSLNFGLAYGEGIVRLCSILGVPLDRGRQIIEEYHRRAPFIRPLSQQVMRRASQVGEIKTLLQRRRHFNGYEYAGRFYPPGMPHPRAARRAYTHKGLNALIQGSAADIMKKAMVMVADSGVLTVLGAPHLTVHDELDFSKPTTKAAAEAVAELHHIMETCVALRVPLLVKKEEGRNWGDTK